EQIMMLMPPQLRMRSHGRAPSIGRRVGGTRGQLKIGHLRPSAPAPHPIIVLCPAPPLLLLANQISLPSQSSRKPIVTDRDSFKYYLKPLIAAAVFRLLALVFCPLLRP